MGQLHPVLDTLMLEHGYGRVLSRPGLSLRLRELCVIAVLVGQDVSPQLVNSWVASSCTAR
jgi:alkylhydroperoxidase/carboxymuconolactone decarboxylase family protein YurZ